MTEVPSTSSSLIQVAILRAYSNLDSSTRAILAACQLMVARNPNYWYIAFVAPNVPVWKRIVKRLFIITRRFYQTTSSFMLAVCTLDDPMPPGGLGVGRIKRMFEINSCQFVQVTHDEHPYWMEVIPREALFPLPPSDSVRDDDEDNFDLPF
jgi:hypothetical protein